VLGNFMVSAEITMKCCFFRGSWGTHNKFREHQTASTEKVQRNQLSPNSRWEPSETTLLWPTASGEPAWVSTNCRLFGNCFTKLISYREP
jgi:hypothetical protein